ncbi:hypothetical protein N7470_004418 [Penicillium chermesinum]|nr:hypothetical protein N7470_004418 [Penicillium chermesinum]
MAYFLPSFFQRRLLKYALSRVGLVDTEALDPDNLGIRFGQRSTVELRDIGLKLDKLATLLNLPPSYEVLSARIAFLRITVPADIYSSSIICEATGIHVHIQCLSEEAGQGKSGKGRSSSSPKASLGDEQIIPTPSNLAESFLQTEPKEEKEELQAAISSQSHILQRESSSSDQEEDEEELGLGNEATSLPSFVAGFLKGVADRLQLIIKDVAVRLDMGLKQEAPSKRQPEEKPDVVAGLFTIGEINVYGVSGVTTGPDGTPPLREGKRLLSLSDINLGLVADPMIFANYSRFTSPPSPTTTMHSKEGHPLSRATSPPFLDAPEPEADLAMTRSTIFEPSPAFSQCSVEQHGMEASSFSNDGRFSDANSYTESAGRSPYESQVFEDDPFQDNPGYLDSVIDSQFDYYDEQLPPTMQSSGGPIQASRRKLSQGNSSYLNHVAGGDEYHDLEDNLNSKPSHGSHLHDHESHKQHGPQEDVMVQSSTLPLGEENFIRHLNSSQNAQDLFPPSNPGSENSAMATSDANLTESKYFSHDEAQSLYMSAVSQGSHHMPGAWDSSGRQDDLKDSNSFQQSRSIGPSPEAEENQENVGDSTPKIARTTRLLLWDQHDSYEYVIISIRDKLYPPASFEKADSDNNDLAYGVEESMFASKTYASTRLPQNLAEPSIASESGATGQQQPAARRQELAVEAFAVNLHFDIATGWLLVKISQKLSRSIDTPQNDQRPKSPKTSPNESTPQNPLNVTLIPPPSPPSPLEDIVLRATASGLKLNLSSSDKKTNVHLGIAKFSFGVASEDFICFNESLKMRESTRDIMSNSHDDISLSLVKTANSAKVEVSTLPLHINFNIQYLEEVLGWLGGLSTILELGSSISSTSTMKGGANPVTKRPRGVHFETPAPISNKESSNSTLLKVNARIGGIALDVIGESHFLKLTTTAVKIVSRFEGIGVQIDKTRLSGPLPVEDTADAPAQVTLNNIRLEFLFAPKEVDLDRLLTLITPSKDKYEDEDDIMLETLLRQRRQGSVLRTTVGRVETIISETDKLAPLSTLGLELSRLSNVTKYLPEDDRPGLLTLTLLREFDGRFHLNGEVGSINTHFKDVEAAWISMPSLIAMQIGSIFVDRNGDEELIGEALLPGPAQSPMKQKPPVLMARFIPDEMDPTFKIKLHHLRAEYKIPSVMAFLGLSHDATSGELTSEMATSIANLAEHSARAKDPSAFSSGKSESSKEPSKPMKLAVIFRDTVLGLNPRNSSSKALAVLTNAKFSGTMHSKESSDATFDIRKASLMIIDDVKNAGKTENLHQRRSAVIQNSQTQAYIDAGYVPVTSISSATAIVKLMRLAEDGTQSLDVEFRDDLLILETCADSTQTLITILNGLQPPTPPNVTAKYRTEVMPIQDMLASFTGDAFSAGSDEAAAPYAEPDTDLLDAALDNRLSEELEYVSDFYPGSEGSEHPEAGQEDLVDSFRSEYYVSSSIGELDFQDDHFAKQSAVGGTAHRWDSTHNTYGLSNDQKLQRSPLRVRVRDMHIIWNLFDGYDWQRTRDTISKAVKDVEVKATERRAQASRMSPDAEEEEESVIGDFLFNSIYIGIPANKDPRELHREINRDINDLTSETGSYATTTTVTGATSRQGRSGPEREKKLRLHRSKHHKMTFELRGVSADLVVFPPGSEETQSSLDVRVKDLEIFDHVPTSTWKKFATYMHEAGERETGTCMLHLEILTVKPVPELAASEIVLKATILPLRLIVDQDALDFMSRFFEFRDDSAEVSSTPGDVPFLQRVEINAIKVKLDFKPKRVDYAGLRSGRTTEFMNFFVLDGADMVLRHVIIYGISGFDRLGNTLNDIWMPDVKRNQLPGVLAGLAPIRSLVNVGGGVKDLVVVPMREYKKDGRIVRSIQKGAVAFAKTTSNEIVKLGAKLAIGTQTVLQGAEDLLTSPNAIAASEESGDDEDEVNKISPYADQPIGVVQGLRGAFRGLERDLLLARDAIVAVPGEVVESGNAVGAARAVWKRAPTVILRPAIGVSKAVGQTLLGAGNTLDPTNRRRAEDKYKRR